MKKEVTIVYTVEDEEAFQRAGNPLRFEHHGLKAHTIAVGDSHVAYTELENTLHQIADSGERESTALARAALKSNRSRIENALK